MNKEPHKRGPNAIKPEEQVKKRGNPESSQQQAYIKWFELQYPELRDLLTASPNGGKRDKRTAAILKREGVLSGWPDITLALPVGPYHGFFMEAKTPEGSLSPRQKVVLRALQDRGYCCTVSYGLDAMIADTKAYLQGRIFKKLFSSKEQNKG